MMRQIINVIFLTIIILGSSFSVLGDDEEIEKEIIVNKIRITENDQENTHPKIFKDLIVWLSNKTSYTRGDVYVKNLHNNITRRLTYDGNNTEIQIFGDIITWWNYELRRAYVYNYTQNSVIRELSFVPRGIFKSKLLHINYNWSISNDTWDYYISYIYLYDLTTDIYTLIHTVNSSIDDVNIYNELIVWEDHRYDLYPIANWNISIFSYNMESKEERFLTNEIRKEVDPVIWGELIVWIDYRHRVDDDIEKKDIYFYNYSTKEEKRITETTTSWGKPSIWKDNIVWVRAYNIDEIYLYNIPTNITYIIEVELATRDVDIYENRIVFVSNENDNPDIYMLEFFFPESPPPQPEPKFWEKYAVHIIFLIIVVIVIIVAINTWKKLSKRI